MKQFFLLGALCLISYQSMAAVGDTTFVQGNIVNLNYYNNFDSTIVFPNGTKSYQKIIMIFTLGKYSCPPGTQYCSDWDYTVQNFLMTKTGDTVELGRLITPYANTSYARFPMTWKQRYTYDVTDLYPLLKDSATVRIHYSGYSGGFTANITFAFIEGTPPRNVLGITKLWNKSVPFGNANNPITNTIAPVTVTPPLGTVSSAMKFIISGHGSDANGCSEFCSKYYDVMVDGNSVAHKDIWRANCGFNHLYPQSGTWIYDRGNWCPGDKVFETYFPLTGLAAGIAKPVDVEFENYQITSPSASYTISGYAYHYGAFNNALDASLEEIIAPSNHEINYRENHRVGTPVIRVRNIGGSNITSIKLQYKVLGTSTGIYTYVWNGTLAPLADTVIELPEDYDLRTSASGTNYFQVSILKVNNQDDANATNNSLTVDFTAAPVWENQIVVKFKTNSAQETSYTIKNAAGVIVAQRSAANLAANTVYTDTVNLPPSWYVLEVTDDGCDGLKFWANSAQGVGYIQIFRTSIPIQYSLKNYFSGDFGCGFKHYFSTAWPAKIPTITKELVQMEAVPNPANQLVELSFSNINEASGHLIVVNAMGMIVISQEISNAQHTFSVADLANGVYELIYVNDQLGTTAKTKLVVNH